MRRFVLQVLLWIALLGVCSPVAAETSSQKLLLLSGNSCAGSVLTLDILNGVYCTPGQRVSNLLSLPVGVFSRPSPKTALNKAGQVVSFASGVPAITDLGWLDEAAATNLLTQSQNIVAGVGGWAAGTGNTTTSNATTAPNGTLTASFLKQDTSTGLHRMANNQMAPSGATAYALTIYAKGNGTRYLYINAGSYTGASICFDLQTGTVAATGSGAGSISTLTNGWFRLTTTATSGGAPSSTWFIALNQTGVAADSSYTGDGTSGVYLWGAQLETGSAASSYIATTTAAVTRAADALSLTYSGSPTSATVTYGSNSTATPSPSSPLNLGSSSGGAWVGSYVTKAVVR